MLVRGGTVVDPVDGARTADVEIRGGRITRVGPGADRAALRSEAVLDAGGRLVVPGFVDTHSHADARVLDDDVQLALLRQGVTAVITGQDGVSFAPGDGAYATEYFGALNAAHPTYRGPGVAALLESYDGRTRLNVGYLVPAGTVRYDVVGTSPERPSAAQLAAMVDVVRRGLADGALGLSSGLDYVPGCFADAAELAALCAPVAAAGAVYVTHMRGYEESSPRGLAEVEEICRASGVAAHVSHFHAPAALARDLLAGARRRGADLTFDAYPYARGFTLLSMVLLPPDVVAQGAAVVGATLRDPTGRARMAQRLDADRRAGLASHHLAPGWAGRMLIASAGTADGAWAEGRTVETAAAAAGITPTELALRLLGASDLRVTVVLDLPDPRGDDELAVHFADRGAMCGSDGIYLGSSPHPRAWGAFARMLRVLVRERGDLGWPDAVRLLSARPVQRFGLGERGRVSAGSVADLALVDPSAVTDRADYARPTVLATGIDDVLVNGVPVLAAGRLAPELAGRGLRRSGRPPLTAEVARTPGASGAAG